jgi:predicted  nucleic acid-binding Zn-ribbon protein
VKTKFNAYEKSLYDFVKNIYVICPKCGNQALVKSKGFLYHENEEQIKLICLKCGMNKYYSEKPKDKFISERSGIQYETRNYVYGANIDPFFNLPLWLQKEMPDGLLWAYNYEHLNFIENHIRAELRYRKTTISQSSSIGSRLPKWMSAKKNRNEILNGIEKLKQK